MSTKQKKSIKLNQKKMDIFNQPINQSNEDNIEESNNLSMSIDITDIVDIDDDPYVVIDVQTNDYDYESDNNHDDDGDNNRIDNDIDVTVSQNDQIPINDIAKRYEIEIEEIKQKYIVEITEKNRQIQLIYEELEQYKNRYQLMLYQNQELENQLRCIKNKYQKLPTSSTSSRHHNYCHSSTQVEQEIMNLNQKN